MTQKEKLPVVCIVDDERSIGRSLIRLFRRLPVTVETFTDPKGALIFLREHPVDVLITDQRMPGLTGTQLIDSLDSVQDNCVRFILSGYSDFDEITEAFNSGKIQKYISKPWDDEELLFVVEKALSENNSETVKEAQHLGTSQVQQEAFLGSDPCMVDLFARIGKMSTANVPIFIHGETGTGKELVAKSLHQQSFRADQAFVAVNCANFSAELMESQLFGHKKGAFTGADRDYKGLIHSANGGTLFLDEVTTLPMQLQSKLLRVLQEREYSPLGSTELISFDAQILSASSVSLAQAVCDGTFREDLRYRLEVLPLDIPPLRDRGRDALLLFDHYLHEIRQDTRFEFTKEFEEFLLSYEWPGNVRQLTNIAGYVATMADSVQLDLSCLPTDLSKSPVRSSPVGDETEAPATEGYDVEVIQPLRETERIAIERALELCDNNIPQAAAMLEISASTVYRKMQSWSEESQA